MHANNDEQRRLMLTEPIGRLLFKKALPTVIIQLITVIYNTADTYFVAKHQRDLAVAIKRARVMALLPFAGERF